jgi:hypothetical protein
MFVPDSHLVESLLHPKGISGSKVPYLSDKNALLVQLREREALPWSQIADYFPGRSVASSRCTIQLSCALNLDTHLETHEDADMRKLIYEYSCVHEIMMRQITGLEEWFVEIGTHVSWYFWAQFSEIQSA